jgi:hypothetical protein
MKASHSGFRIALVLASALIAPVALAGPAPAAAPTQPLPGQTAEDAPLELRFQDPPMSARPRVWWHWMNGNVTKDGIAKDMAWMKRVGIGGLQNFDANLTTPQIVAHRLVYMTPEWKDAFRFAATEADRLGLELAIASSPGWSETGGPWVPPADGLKKVVWSETIVDGGSRAVVKLAPPPGITGAFQTLPPGLSIEEMMSGAKAKAPPQASGDIAVIAVPAKPFATVIPAVALANGTAVDGGKLFDNDLASGVDVPRGSAAQPGDVRLTYATPQTIRSMTLFVAGAKLMFGGPAIAPVLEASDDGRTWRKIATPEAGEVPTTVSFAPVTARYFRLVLHPLAPSMSNMSAPAPGIAAPFDLAAMAAGAKTPWQVRQLTLSAQPQIDQFETKAAFSLAMDYFALGQTADGANGPAPAQVIDLTDKLRADGTLDWTPPKGTWRVLRMGWSLLGTTNHPATEEATGLEVDKFDGAAVRRYIDHYLEMYRDAAGPGMIGAHGVRALLTDSIEVGAANWTPRMIQQFKALRGYDPTPWLPALAGVLIGSRADSDRFLYDYRRTLADLMASEHYGTIAQAAHEAGLKVYGEALEDKRPSIGDDMAMRKAADVPMSALWTYPREAGPNPSYLADMKGAASVAHVYGQNLVAAESMTSAISYWADSPQTLKRIIDLEFVTGINRPVVHTSVHQPTDDKVSGLSLFIFGQYFNRHESWAELARPWVDYISRNSLMLQQGRNFADVAYFYGEEAPLTGLYGVKPVADAPSSNAYDFVNADALMNHLSNDGADLATSGGARYRVLYLGGSSARMTLAALRKIAVLVEGGATVVGLAPVADPSAMEAGHEAEWRALVDKLWSNVGTAGGETKLGKGRVIASAAIEPALRGIGIGADFAFTGGGADAQVLFLHRKLADGDSYFLSNRLDRPETVEAHFRIVGKVPELWHAETGKSEPVSYRIVDGETVVPLALGADESVHVVFRKPASAVALAVAHPVPVKLGELSGAWSVAFEAGRGAPANVTLPALGGLEAQADPGVRYFSGVATYRKSFTLPKGAKRGRPLWLDLGSVHELAEVRVNGALVGTAWHAPFRLDIGAAIKPGKNILEVRVANLWINRLIGDAQKPTALGAQKVTWTALPAYRADAPLRPSGLIGPVTLLGE